jgi:hypothetical protein
MGIGCGFYRMNNDMVDFLKSNPENAQAFIDENYCWAGGKYHIENDIVFDTDKAWDIAKFLLNKCDPTPNKVLQKLDGTKIDPRGDWDGSRYISPEQVKEVHGVLGQITFEKLVAAYNRQDMIDSHVYKADWFEDPNWDYIFSHVDTMKKAFARAVETGDNIVIHFY